MTLLRVTIASSLATLDIAAHASGWFDIGSIWVVGEIESAVFGCTGQLWCAKGQQLYRLQVGGSKPKKFVGLQLPALSLHTGTPVRESRKGRFAWASILNKLRSAWPLGQVRVQCLATGKHAEGTVLLTMVCLRLAWIKIDIIPIEAKIRALVDTKGQNKAVIGKASLHYRMGRGGE